MEPLATSVAGAAEALGLGRTKIYELINEGDLSTIKVGRRTLIRVESVRAFIDRCAKAGT